MHLLSILIGFSDLNESVIYSDYWKANKRLRYYGVKEYYRENIQKVSFQMENLYQ